MKKDTSRGQRCGHVKPDGRRCAAFCRAGRKRCVFHDTDPEAVQARKAGRKLGGVNRSRKAAVLPGAADVRPKTPAEVADLMGQTISETRRGALDPRVANALGYLAGVLLRALEAAEMEALAQEVAELRRQIAEVKLGHRHPGTRSREVESVPFGADEGDPVTGLAAGRPGPPDDGGGLESGPVAEDVATLPLYPDAAAL